MSTKILLLLGLLLVTYLIFTGLSFYNKISISRETINKTEKFERLTENYKKTILVLGDSTAYGVGADKKEESLAGLIFEHTKATYLENKSLSGAKIEDLFSQLNNISQDKYDYILIQIGGNEVIRFQDYVQNEKNLEKIKEMLPKHNHLIVIAFGDVGNTQLFPFFLRPFYSHESNKYHQIFEKVFQDNYVNLNEAKTSDPFVQNPEVFLSPDGLHPSSLGYKYWFKKILEKKNI
jgi:lysophospholipase L1-like esterase